MKNIKIFAPENTKEFARRVCQKVKTKSALYDPNIFGIPLGNSMLETYSDGEIQPRILESVSGKKVYVIQSLTPPAENIIELGLLGRSMSSAKRRTLILTYMGYARQDRKDKPGVPIGAKWIADLISMSGFDEVVCIDLHAEQIEGFFEQSLRPMKVRHVSAGKIFVPYIQSLQLPNLLIASPDNGGGKRASEYAKALDVDMVVCYKKRSGVNKVAEIKILGDVKGKDVVLIDDLIDTAGSITKVADKMTAEGASSVRAAITHPVMSGGAYSNIEKSSLIELITTDTIPLKPREKFVDPDKSLAKINVISIDQMIADVIDRLYRNKGLDSHFNLRRYEK